MKRWGLKEVMHSQTPESYYMIYYLELFNILCVYIGFAIPDVNIVNVVYRCQNNPAKM